MGDSQAGRFKRNLTFGLAYTGLLPDRESDVLGFAVSVGWAGDSLRQVNKSMGTPIEDEEIVLELTYQLSPLPWLTLQPDIQWFIHPGLSESLDNTLFLGMRAEVAF